MIDNDLKEIESHIGFYRSENIRREENPCFEMFNPNADIQRLVNEVRRLNVEIDGGEDNIGIPVQGWKELATVLKARVGELERENEDWPGNWQEQAAAFRARIQELQGAMEESAELHMDQTKLIHEAETVQVELMKEKQKFKSDLETNAALLAKQTDLAREAETEKWKARDKAFYLSNRLEESKKEIERLMTDLEAWNQAGGMDEEPEIDIPPELV